MTAEERKRTRDRVGQAIERERQRERERERHVPEGRERQEIAARIKRARYQYTLGRLRCRVEVSIRAKIHPRRSVGPAYYRRYHNTGASCVVRG